MLNRQGDHREPRGAESHSGSVCPACSISSLARLFQLPHKVAMEGSAKGTDGAAGMWETGKAFFYIHNLEMTFIQYL